MSKGLIAVLLNSWGEEEEEEEEEGEEGEEEGEEGEEEEEEEKDLQLMQSGAVGELLLSQHLFCLENFSVSLSKNISLDLLLKGGRGGGGGGRRGGG